MNFQNTNNVYNRQMKPNYGQSYGQYNQQQASLQQSSLPLMTNYSTIPNMSQMSQDINEYRSKHNAYQANELIARDSLSFKNYQIKSLNENQKPNNNSININNSSMDQADFELLLSPIILKGYNILRECQFNTKTLNQIQERLAQHLVNIKNIHKKFNNRMQQLIRLAQQKYKMAEETIKNKQKWKKNNNRTKSVDSLTKRQVKRDLSQNKYKEQDQDAQNFNTPRTIKPQKRGRGRPRGRGIKRAILISG